MSLQLGYLGFEVADLAAWETFATHVLGLQVSARRDDGGLALRMDAQEQRFTISPGPANDLSFVGWQVPDRGTLDRYAERLSKAGVEVEACERTAAERRVASLIRFRDPAGVPVELFVSPAQAQTPFVSATVRSGFVTAGEGLGHVVLGTEDLDRSLAFYRDLLDFKLSDRITCDVYGFPVDIVFLHANTRHHSLALGRIDRSSAFGRMYKKRMFHFMLEVGGMDDVGLAFDRAARSGIRITQTLGKHPNDRMFSFYARTPSGFEFELGWGGQKVDDETWKPTTYDHISEWGHHPPQFLADGKIK
jgi:2,3-dihydroxybiphenyl 1,2-dioxygenase